MPDNHYVHLKDGVVFAHHQTDGEIETSETIVTVSGEEAPYLNKIQNSDGTFSDAPEIRYAILDSNNTVIKIETTYFSSEAGTNPIITDPDVKVLWTWDGTKFNSPDTRATLPTTTLGDIEVTTSASLQPTPLEVLESDATRQKALQATVVAPPAPIEIEVASAATPADTPPSA
jgi:hypothetical protein